MLLKTSLDNSSSNSIDCIRSYSDDDDSDDSDDGIDDDSDDIGCGNFCMDGVVCCILVLIVD